MQKYSPTVQEDWENPAKKIGLHLIAGHYSLDVMTKMSLTYGLSYYALLYFGTEKHY